MARSTVERNTPIKVLFAGFETDTYTLSRNGWDIAMDESAYDSGLRAMFHHQGLQMTMLGELVGHGLMGPQCYRRQRERMMGQAMGRFQYQQEFDVAYIQIRTAGSKGQVFVRCAPTIQNMTWRDTEPMIDVVRDFELHSLPLFAELGKPSQSQELIVEPKDVQQLLDQILKMQAPGMREIRARNRERASEEPKRLVHAQIVSLNAA